MKGLSQCRVLIVDDLKANVDLLVGALRDDYRLSVALDGERALEIIGRQTPDLVLLDVMMPGIDGFEVCRRIRADAATRDLPIMFLTTLDDVADKTAGFEAGGNDYLTKPFHVLEVQSRVRALLQAKVYHDAVRERYESELRIARGIQMGMVRDDVARVGAAHGLDVFSLFEPAREVGGDLYEVMPRDGGRACLVLGDVSGKGVPAALFMAMTLTLLRAAIRQGLGPSGIVAYVNDELSDHNPECMFVTLICAVIDPTTGEVELANAGHPAPALLRLGAAPCFAEGCSGPLVGFEPGAEFPVQRLRLDAGDALVLYTDGVTEAFDADMEPFGETRLLAGLPRSPSGARQIAEALRGAVAAYVGAAPQSDDIAILAVRRPPQSDGDRVGIAV